MLRTQIATIDEGTSVTRIFGHLQQYKIENCINESKAIQLCKVLKLAFTERTNSAF